MRVAPNIYDSCIGTAGHGSQVFEGCFKKHTVLNLWQSCYALQHNLLMVTFN